MRLAVVVLILLGLLAAGAAVLAVNVFQERMNPGDEPEGVSVLVAREKLPARKLIDEVDVEVQKVPKTGLPKGYFTNPSQALGKVLKMAVTKGEPLTDAVFIPKGSVDELLRPGMLAFPASLSRRSTAVDLLYPGCVVDVFATFPLRDSARGDAVVTPLLQKIQVLGIQDITVVTQQDAADMRKGTSTNSNSSVTVTLEVSARQAAALQLAMDRGTLGLAMRNPLDTDLNPMEPMVVREGQLIAASEVLDPATLSYFTNIQRVLRGEAVEKPAEAPKPPVATTTTAAAGTEPGTATPGTEPAPTPASAVSVPEIPLLPPAMTRGPTTMEVTVILGPKVTKEEIPLEQGGSQEQDE